MKVMPMGRYEKTKEKNLLWEILYTFQPRSGSIHLQGFINVLPFPWGYVNEEMR